MSLIKPVFCSNCSRGIFVGSGASSSTYYCTTCAGTQKFRTPSSWVEVLIPDRIKNLQWDIKVLEDDDFEYSTIPGMQRQKHIQVNNRRIRRSEHQDIKRVSEFFNSHFTKGTRFGLEIYDLPSDIYSWEDFREKDKDEVPIFLWLQGSFVKIDENGEVVFSRIVQDINGPVKTFHQVKVEFIRRLFKKS